MKLQEWAVANAPSKDMVYYDGYWDQIMLIRDRITHMIFGSRYEGEPNIEVVSTHVSKSINLPVYSIKIPNLQIELILRGNFHDWKVSVLSEHPVDCDFHDLFDGSKQWNYHYCEGFDHNWIYEPFNQNNKQFTVEVLDAFNLYTFIWKLVNHIKKATDFQSTINQ